MCKDGETVARLVVRVGFKMDKDFKISTESDDKGED